MERLLVVKLDAVDCDTEAWLNGVPVARADAARPRAVVPVHEYTLAGVNRLQLVVWPAPVVPPPADGKPPPPALPAVPRIADGRQSAALRVLLPRVGQPADEASARTLGQIDWAPAAGTAHDAPLTLSEDITLPVSFPRWRWLDAPPSLVTPALQQHALAFVQQLAVSLAGGDVEPFLTATRLRTEELAVAYQRQAVDEAARLRTHLAGLLAAQRLQWLPMDAAGFTLRSLAGGRLLECLDAGGAPMLRSVADAAGRSVAFPLRVAAVDNRFYVLR